MSVGIRAHRDAVGRVSCVAVTALALATALGAFHDTVTAIVTTWYSSSSFNHAFLIIPICLYLAWRKRADLAAADLSPSIWGMAGVTMAAFGWLLGRVTGALVVQEIALVSVLEGLILALCGWRICRVLAFPFLYLFLAVPMGEALVPSLQAQTARIAVGMLELTGVPVFADGNVISTPTGTFQVAEECSGVRFLIASIALGVLFAGLAYRSWWRRATFLVLSTAVPILANGLRAFGIIFIAYVSNNQLALGIDHIVYGWIFFTAISFITLAVGMTFQERQDFQPPNDRRLTLPRVPSLARLLSFGMLATAPVLAARAYGDRMDQFTIEGSVQLHAPAAAEPWHETEHALDPLAPLFAAPDVVLDAAYEARSAKVYLHVGYYVRERRGAEVATSEQKLVPAKQWLVTASGERSAVLGDEAMTVQFIRATSGAKTRSIWYWYWVDGHFTGDPYVAKLLQAKTKLLGGQQSAAIIEIAIDSERDSDGAEESESLASFLASLLDLPQTLSRGSTLRRTSSRAADVSDYPSQRG